MNEKSTTQPQRNWINPRSLYAYRTATLHNLLKHYDLSDVTPLQLLLWDQPLNHIGCQKKSTHDSWLQTQPVYHNGSIKVQFMANWLPHSLTFLQHNIISHGLSLLPLLWDQPLNHSCAVSNFTVLRSTTQPHRLQMKISMHDVWCKLNHSTTNIQKWISA